MSYELVNQATEVCRTFSRQSWTKALELARLYGWQPTGTRLPLFYNFSYSNAEWNGTYLTNEGQIVKAEDAYSLAAALERSLPDIPEANRKMDWAPQLWSSDDYPEWLD